MTKYTDYLLAVTGATATIIGVGIELESASAGIHNFDPVMIFFGIALFVAGWYILEKAINDIRTSRRGQKQ